MPMPLPLDYPQPLGTYESRAAARHDVEFLARRGFPVENVAIVGTDLKHVERMTAGVTAGRATAAGAAAIAWLGLLLGILLWLFGPADGRGSSLTVLVPIALGAPFGAALGLAAYLFTGGPRVPASAGHVIPTRYELVCDHRIAAQARELLAQQLV
ncbi:MAG: rane protein [Mycobacterium sp.]|nr:rane protein [Mycobacterium sp.]